VTSPAIGASVAVPPAASPPPVSPPPVDRAELEAALGHRFRDPALLAEALTHASATSGGSGRARGRAGRGGGDPAPRRRSNERLEFLGDRVLGLVVAHALIRRFPDDAEGALTDRHVALVQRATLAAVGERLGLGRWLEVARGEDESGGRERPALLADGCEAVIAALYLDGGLEAARGFVERAWEPFLLGVAVPPRDAKMALQEWAQARGLEPPAYRVAAEEGPPHAPRFTVEASLPGWPPGRGEGASKRAAERAAARLLLEAVRGGAGRG
jgi:ribonuclease-3